MRKIFRFTAPLVALAVLVGMTATVVQGKGTRGLATITGTVRDNKGMPLAGAVIQLIREGANQFVKQTRTAADGSFSAKIPAGRYSLKAIAEGFGEVLFSSVQVSPSAEIAYRFNLEPADSPNTLVNQRKDKDNVKWTLRSVQGRRSIFQIEQGDDSTIAAVEAADEVSETNSVNSGNEHGKVRTQGVVETYFAASPNPFASSYEGVNFAVALPASETIDLIFAGQSGVGAGAPQRFETSARWRANNRHRVSLTAGAASLSTSTSTGSTIVPRSLGQVSVRAVDEWIVRDGVVVVFGLDYSRFLGAGNAASISPRLGIQFDANARTRVHAAYAPGQEADQQSSASFESGDVVFKQPNAQPIAFVGGRAVMGQSRRLEFGMERVLDNRSSLEATAFLDLTSGRGVGLMATPLSAFSGDSEVAIQKVANQEGSARGVRLVYSRRLSHGLNASAGYSFGRGQKLSPNGLTNPADFFSNSFFQSAALQVTGNWSTGTHVQTVFRFSPQATVFAIDPFAGRLAVYDPSLSIQVTQDLPTFGLPVRAQAVVDARNLLDFQSRTGNNEAVLEFAPNGRSLRGGIAVRF